MMRFKPISNQRQHGVMLLTLLLVPGFAHSQDVAEPSTFTESSLTPAPADAVEMRCAVFSPDGKSLAVGARGFIALFDVATLRERARVNTDDIVRSLAFSPDGKTLATANDDASVRLWSTATWQETLAIPGYPTSVRYIAYSPDGKLFATATTGRSSCGSCRRLLAEGPRTAGSTCLFTESR